MTTQYIAENIWEDRSSPQALIVEGGAMRGVFSTGVLDGFLEARFNPFDLCVGVSAGAANMAAFLAEMPQRNLKIYTDYSLRPQFINFWRFLRGGHLMDLDWLWDITIEEIRLDLKTIFASGKCFVVCLTDVATGQALYKHPHSGDLEDILKASSALPILYRGFPLIDGHPAVDGGIADPIPVRQALKMGARKIMVIRSRPKSYEKKEKFSQAIMLNKMKPFPALSQAISYRIKRYNEAVSLIRNPPSCVSITEICPPENFKPGRLGKNKKVLMEGYEQGRNISREAMEAWAR
ncbi:MAG: patatin family protein [Desulfatibacillum sp.]|nr:patatin family protein [Desulfatibacillum sp.]